MSCGKKDACIEIMSKKQFNNNTCIYMCYTTEKDFKKIEDDIKSMQLFENSNLGWAFIYDNRSRIIMVEGFDNVGEAVEAADGGYIASFDKSAIGEQFYKNESTLSYDKVESEKKAFKENGEVKIIQLDAKIRTGKGTIKPIYRWFTFYVENFFDSEKTYDKIKEECYKLPFDPNGFTIAYFFNNKEKAPKLAEDGGWASNESQDSWNKKYAFICIGYFEIGSGDNKGYFSKRWD
jgi:hypothetical protein